LHSTHFRFNVSLECFKSSAQLFHWLVQAHKELHQLFGLRLGWLINFCMGGPCWLRLLLLRGNLKLLRLYLLCLVLITIVFKILCIWSHERILRLLHSLRKWGLRYHIRLLMPHNFYSWLKCVFRNLLLLRIWIRCQRKYFTFAILWACSVRILQRRGVLVVICILFLSFALHLDQLLMLLFD
jgi:hypothetical protein